MRDDRQYSSSTAVHDAVDELLAEDETLQECKSQNQKLVEFLTKKENMSRLIEYATRLPRNVNSKDQAYK